MYGGTFYALIAGTRYLIRMPQIPTAKPRFTRQTESCTVCHSSRNAGGPALLIRSVYAAREGHPILSGGSHRIDHTSPIKDRWGGWYVTGTHGTTPHLGTLVVQGRRLPTGFPHRCGDSSVIAVPRAKGRLECAIGHSIPQATIAGDQHGG